MRSTMQERPLLMRDILRHGKHVHGSSEVVTYEGESFRRTSFAEVAGRAEQLAAALDRLGVGRATAWRRSASTTKSTSRPTSPSRAMGAVLHTLNVRLFPEQLAYVIDHAEDKVIIADAMLAPALARVLSERDSVEHVIVVGDGDASLLGETLAYEELLGAEAAGFAWPDLDETRPPPPCATRAGRRADPKGVVYSHRSTYLHSLAATSAAVLGISGHDRVLVVVPQFHANAWGMPYAAWLSGADLIMPRQFLQASRSCGSSRASGPTFACAVPTIWNEVFRYAEEHDSDLSSFRAILCGGAPVPRSLIERFEERLRRPDHPGLGDDRDEPARSRRPASVRTWRPSSAARVPLEDGPGRVRRRDPRRRRRGRRRPRDGTSIGEFEVRGPWVTGEYYDDPTPDRFRRRLAAHRRRRHRRRPRASCRSPTGPRTSSRPAASGSPRSSSRTPSWRTRRCSRRPSSPCPMPAGTSARSPASCSSRARRASAAELAGWLGDKVPALVGPRALVVRERDPEDERRQVRQEGAACRPVQGRARDRHHRAGRRTRRSRTANTMDDETLEAIRAELDTLGRAARRRRLRVACGPSCTAAPSQPRPTPTSCGKSCSPGPATPSSGPRRSWPRPSGPRWARAEDGLEARRTPKAQARSGQRLMASMSMRSRPCERRSNSSARRLSSRWSRPARSGGSGPVRQMPFGRADVGELLVELPPAPRRRARSGSA